MVRVLIHVQQGASHFDVSVQAQSIWRAVSIAATRHPGADVRVMFPLDPEAFFVEEPSALAYSTGRERLNGVAA